MLFFPIIPVLYGDIYLAYRKHDSKVLNVIDLHYPYVCYSNSRYDDYLVHTQKVLFNNKICYPSGKMFRVLPKYFNWISKYFPPIDRDLREYYQTLNVLSKICNRSNMYQCIPNRLLMDNVNDCPFRDDENITEIINILSQEELTGINPDYSDEVKKKLRYARYTISFQTICDGFIESIPITIQGRNETDETECEQWECDNIYTRCNGLWICLNGADELACNSVVSSNYSPDHHMCISPHTNQLTYLPIKNANDGNVDCIGGIDEPLLCRKPYKVDNEDGFLYDRLSNPPFCTSFLELCVGIIPCLDSSLAEQFCKSDQNQNSEVFPNICLPDKLPFASDVQKLLCQLANSLKKEQVIYFTLDGIDKSVENPQKYVKNTMLTSSSNVDISHQYQSRCHRDLDLRVWLNDEDNKTSTCLCSPSHYGDRCQYQNQRISLTMKFQAFPDSLQIPFTIVILLIDDSDERIIYSYEQFTYLSTRDCKIKFNTYSKTLHSGHLFIVDTSV